MNPMNSHLGWLIGILLILAIGCSASKQTIPTSPRLLAYQFEQLDSLMQERPRSVAVFLHTTWCRYCENMKQTTFAHSKVIELLNEQYYFVSFDGESTESIRFNGHLFSYQPTGSRTGTHDLAKALGTINGELTYPGFVLLNSDYEIIFQHNAYLNATEMKAILQYVR